MLFSNLVFAATSAGTLVHAAVIGVVRAPVPDPIHPWGQVSGRNTPAENPVTGPGGVVIVYGGRATPAENPVTAPNGGVIVYGGRDTPAEDPVTAPNGGVIVYDPRDTPAENPVTAPGGGVIVPYGGRDTIPA
ncbi:hypothetical protein B0H16DRAFT_1879843 [Mycena metata]|uniref:Uncharacterized protein n=1 Tax=Mycena metata TaxID=1033252 RepID=A0AAD7NUG3_9AGAR|nr:hypothetical protein B0H16DRAFT_1879843 [Mycena metata]